MKHLVRAKQKKPDLPEVFRASDAPIPPKKESIETMEAINRFVRDNPRQDMAGGGMLVQPGFGGTRQGYRGKNIGNIKKETESIDSYIKEFGEETLNKISRKKYKKNFKNLDKTDLNNLKRRVTKFKDFIIKNNRMPTEQEARVSGRASRTLKEADIQIKLINATNENKFFNPKKFAKDNNISLSELKRQAGLLQKNIYNKRMKIAGKEMRFKLDWIPDDPIFSDNALNKLWKSKLIKYERNKIDELFYDAFGREFKKGTREKNPAYNRKKFLAIKNNLNEYRQLREAINAKYPNINFELDHPLSKSSLNKLFNATPEQLTRVNPLEADLNNGFKDTLSLQYEKAVQGNNLNKKKAVEKIAKDLKLNIGKISDDATNFKYGVKEFQKLNIKNEIGKSLENLQFLNKNFQTYAKNNPELFKTAGVSTQQTFTKLDNVKGLSSFMKDLGIKCRLANGVNCNMPQAYQKSIDELTQKAQQGDAAARAKLTRFTNKAATAGRFIKNALGPLAIASELAIEGGIALNKTLQTGVPLKTAFADSLFNLALGPKTRIDKEAELAKEFAKGEDFAMAERGRRMMIPQSAQADAQRQKERMQQMISLYPQYSDQQLTNMLETAGFNPQDIINQQTTTRITPAVTSTLTGLDQLRTDFQIQDALQRVADAGGVANLAGGGIAKEAGDPSGAMLESMNPDSQGLPGLLKRGRRR